MIRLGNYKKSYTDKMYKLKPIVVYWESILCLQVFTDVKCTLNNINITAHNCMFPLTQL